jgi:hypothetical protein
MKRYIAVAVSTCAFVLALAAGPAFAGPSGGSPIPGQNGQSNTSILSNDPVLSGNSVALVNGGSQSSSADATAVQSNTSGASSSSGATTEDPQTAEPSDQPSGPPDPNGGSGGQSNTAVPSNDPVASGNSVALVNGGGCGCDGGSQTSSADPTLVQVNDASSDSKGGDPKQGDGQENVAVGSNDPVASGNSVALVNEGDQTSSASPTLVQVNNSQQGGGASWSKDDCKCQGSKDDSKGDGQKNVAVLSNDPVASGNSVALVNEGDQTSSADPTLVQVNSSDQGGKKGDSKKDGGQKNVAVGSNDPVASGNSVALVNEGDQTSSVSPTLVQVNGSDQGGKKGYSTEPQGPPQQKPCPPKPCEQKPCPPKPCEQKPCPPEPCKGGGNNTIGAVTDTLNQI